MSGRWRHPVVGIVTMVSLLGAGDTAAHGQSATTPTSPAQSAQAGVLFDSDAPLQLRIAVDLRTLVNDRDSVEATYHPATITYQVEDAAPVTLDIRVKTRGHWRRQWRNCEFPPLRLNFPSSGVGGTLFANQNKIKMVTPCRPSRNAHDEYVLREYLAYKIYNLLTPRSFRVRLARTTYVDTRGRRDSLTRHTFLIEDAEQMAARDGGRVIEALGARFDVMDSLQFGLVGVFLYMIGDTDWSPSALHNIEMVHDLDELIFYPVAYDFDFTGIVSAAYAGPNPRLGLRTLRERLYRGRCLSDEHWDTVLTTFRRQRAAIYALYESTPGLSARYVRDTHRYLDEFYEVIDDPGKLSRELMRRCREEESL